MKYEDKINTLALKLFDIDAIKFGDFVTKSGINTPVYFDLRVIVSYPEVMDGISSLLYEAYVKNMECNHICGVPYTALPIATLISVKAGVSMLMRRKEAKSYGTKKMIEGHYKNGQTCLIIEDVVTSGSSVLETVNDLRKEGLITNKAVIILDREQGGEKNLLENGVSIKSLFTMTKLISILLDNRKITSDMAEKVKNYLNETSAVKGPENKIDRTKLSYEERSKLATNDVSKKLFNIMASKRTNLCLSIDFTTCSKILDLLENVGEHICMVKTHIDIIEDFTDDFVSQLKQLAEKYNFLILEDRKFADIGNTVFLQYLKGVYRIGEWADCVTVHSLPGEGILKAINGSINGIKRGVFLLAEMSCQGNLITPEYTEATVKLATKYPDLVVGFVNQNKNTFQDPGLIQLTPGVQLQCTGDDLGQIYNTPEKIIMENGADIAVVGRGIVAAQNSVEQTLLYKKTLWDCYLRRIGEM